MIYVATYLICVIIVLAIWGGVAYKKNLERGEVEDK